MRRRPDKLVYRYTLKEVSKHTGITPYALNRRALKLGLKGKCMGNDSTKYYTRKQIEKIVFNSPVKYENHPRKLDIIELFLKDNKGHEIAKAMNISVKLVYDAIREYNETGCVTVESKMTCIFVC